MSVKVFVGGLPFSFDSEKLKHFFSPYGEIEEAIIIMDRETRRSKGFGFVTFKDESSATKAIAEMHDKDVEGRKISVNVARPMEERAPRRSFDRNSGGRGGGFSRDSRDSRGRDSRRRY